MAWLRCARKFMAAACLLEVLYGVVEMRAEVHGGGLPHVPGHPHALPQVLHAVLDAVPPPRARREGGGGHGIGAHEERVSGGPQHGVAVGDEILGGLGIRVRKGRLEALLARLAHPPGRELDHVGVVAHDLPRGLVARGFIPAVHGGGEGLELQRPHGEGEVPLPPGDGRLRLLGARGVVAVPVPVLGGDVADVRVVVALGGEI
mmetsp:Transcript_18016/g.58310  ORF Transcript_18016/g.58310 Transcript_18016/m.58310 type:complete len:204 (+) Transcript_18016:39-650(+)